MKLKPFNVREWLDLIRVNYTTEADKPEIRLDCLDCGKERHLYINQEDNTFICFKCGIAGGSKQLKQLILNYVIGESQAQPKAATYFASRGLDTSIITTAVLGYYTPMNRYTIPYFNKDGTIYNICFRSANGDGDKYLRFPSVPNHPYVWGPDNAQTVIITEGEIDALSVYQAYPEALVLGLPGATFINDALASYIPPGATLVALVDDDAPGKAAAKKLRKRFPSIKIGVPESGAKDANDLLVSKGVQGLRGRIEAVLHSSSSADDGDTGDTGGASAKYPLRSPAYLSLPDEHGTWLIEDLWIDRSLGFVAGEPKAMKSMLTLHIAYHVATGQPFVGKRILHPGPVLLVQEEDNDLTIKTRLRSINGGQGSDNLWLWTPGAVGEHVRLDSEDSLEKLDVALGEIQPVLVILDPLANMHALESENDAASMNRILERLRYLRDLRKCSIMIVHHLRKEGMNERGMSGQRMRGSSVLHAKSESALYVEKWGDLVRLNIETKTRPGRVIELRYRDSGFVFEDEHGQGVDVDGNRNE